MGNNTNTDIDKLIALGKMALEQGWYDQAREDFERALELDASNSEAKKALYQIDKLLDCRRAPVGPVGIHPAGGSMPLLCKLGFHKWKMEYVRQDSCEMQESCRRCGATRGPVVVRHRWNRDYIKPNSCEMQETCSHCGLTQGRVDVVHEWEWVFPKPNSCIRQEVCKRCKAIGRTDDVGSRQWRRVCVDGAARKRFLTLQQSLADLAKSTRIWYIAATEETDDWKRHAGASSLVTRKPARGTKEFLPHTNVLMYGISFDSKHLFFFPDKVLVFQGQNPVFSDPAYISASYDGLKVQFSASRFRETDPVPNDSKTVGYTWQYVRLDGGPDLRYAHNRRIPIVTYGQIEFHIQTGLSLQFYVSNLAYAKAFVRSLSEYIRVFTIPGPQTSAGKESRQRDRTRTEIESNLESKDPYEILGVRPSASMKEIVAAYRKLAQENHPDKVARLAPEFKELAERRMKVINAAYEELKRKKG